MLLFQLQIMSELQKQSKQNNLFLERLMMDKVMTIVR